MKDVQQPATERLLDWLMFIEQDNFVSFLLTQLFPSSTH